MFRRKSKNYNLETRKSIASHNNIQFIEPAFYKKRELTQKQKLVRIGMLFILAGLLIRIVFMNGGIIELQSKKSELREKFQTLQSVKKENIALKKEIDKIQNDVSYQKKLARDHLGFISEDEHLILFESDLSDTSKEVDPQ